MSNNFQTHKSAPGFVTKGNMRRSANVSRAISADSVNLSTVARDIGARLVTPALTIVKR